MTREDARQIIATWLVSSKGANGQRGYIEGWFDEEDAEAFRMAIDALSAEVVHKPDYSYEADIVRRIKEALSADAEQVTGKLKNPCDSLLTDDSEACKEQKSKLDLIRRSDAIEAVRKELVCDGRHEAHDNTCRFIADVLLSALPSAVCDDCIWHVCNYNKVDWDALLSAKAIQGDGRNNMKRYPNCQMRTALGNCDAIGGFCTSINAQICGAFHKLADAIEVVRCKDCLMTKERDAYTGDLWCCRHREYMTDMYYCADGLRKGDDSE